MSAPTTVSPAAPEPPPGPLSGSLPGPAPRPDAPKPVDEVLRALEPHRARLRSEAAASDRSGSLAAETLALLEDAGAYRLFSERRAGTGALTRLGAGIAELHPAAAWNCIVSNTNALVGARFADLGAPGVPPEVAGQWCGVFASFRAGAEPHPDGGHVVTGSWPYASNSDHASWAILNVAHRDLGAAFILVPRDRLTVEASWSAIGLRGTGSNTLSARGLRVPADRLVPVAELYRVDPSGPFSARFPARLLTSLGLASVGVGAAAAMCEAVVSAAGVAAGVGAGIGAGPDGRAGATPAPGFPGRGPSQPGFVLELGDSQSRIAAARTVLIALGDELDAVAATGAGLPASLLNRARQTVSRVTRDAADAVHELSLIAGSRACLEENEVGRLWRDAHVATRHAALSPAVGFDLGGRALLDPGFDAGAASGALAPARAASDPAASASASSAGAGE